MSCIIGLAHKDKVYIGADSASVEGWINRKTNLQKVFKRGPFLVGYTASFRLGQVLEYHLTVPTQNKNESDMTYMVTKVIDSLRDLLKEKGISKISSNVEEGGRFLVGYRGNLYSIANDYQVGHMSDGFDAIGSGNEIALGALKALTDLPPIKRIKKALEISAYFNMGVTKPFYVKSIGVAVK